MNMLNLPSYLAEIADTLRPPVSNKVIFNGSSLKVMIVGGPNKRDDFHVEDGEELFMQLKGPMELHVMSEGSRKKISINESQMFLLPRHIPHSPQRFPDTLGIVFERTRSSSELDALRWYYPNTNDVLYEEKFHCEDLGTQLKPIIERFFATPEYKQHFNTSASDTRPEVPPVNDAALPMPFLISERLAKTRESQSSGATSQMVVNLFDSEFICNLVLGPNVIDPNSKQQNIACRYFYKNEIFVWQYSGSSCVNGAELSCGDCMLVPPSADTSSSEISILMNTPGSAVLLVYNKADL